MVRYVHRHRPVGLQAGHSTRYHCSTHSSIHFDTMHHLETLSLIHHSPITQDIFVFIHSSLPSVVVVNQSMHSIPAYRIRTGMYSERGLYQMTGRQVTDRYGGFEVGLARLWCTVQQFQAYILVGCSQDLWLNPHSSA
jgi:hypothetical protein